jgi:catechol 2,3-dioxygenase-like lactoylglutathione lyase family enzyme
MLEDARVVPTLPVSSMERARRFYEGKVGLTSIEDEVEGPSAMGAAAAPA